MGTRTGSVRAPLRYTTFICDEKALLVVALYILRFTYGNDVADTFDVDALELVVPDVAADLVDAILCVRSRLIGRRHAHRSDVFGLNYVRRICDLSLR